MGLGLAVDLTAVEGVRIRERHDEAHLFARKREGHGLDPQVAARLARALDRWKKLVEPCRSAAREAIARVAAKSDLSNDVREVVTRALAD